MCRATAPRAPRSPSERPRPMRSGPPMAVVVATAAALLPRAESAAWLPRWPLGGPSSSQQLSLQRRALILGGAASVALPGATLVAIAETGEPNLIGRIPASGVIFKDIVRVERIDDPKVKGLQLFGVRQHCLPWRCSRATPPPLTARPFCTCGDSIRLSAADRRSTRRRLFLRSGAVLDRMRAQWACGAHAGQARPRKRMLAPEAGLPSPRL